MSGTELHFGIVRGRLRDARRALAAAALAGDQPAQREAAVELLAAVDAARAFYRSPTPRVLREWRRWRRYATGVLRAGIVCAGLLARARRLADASDNAIGDP